MAWGTPSFTSLKGPSFRHTYISVDGTLNGTTPITLNLSHVTGLPRAVIGGSIYIDISGDQNAAVITNYLRDRFGLDSTTAEFDVSVANYANFDVTISGTTGQGQEYLFEDRITTDKNAPWVASWTNLWTLSSVSNNAASTGDIKARIALVSLNLSAQ